MRPGEFWEAIIAWSKDKEADRRHVAEVIRGCAVRLFNIQLKPSDQIQDISKFLRLPWDEEEEIDPEVERLGRLTPEERNAEAQAFISRIHFKE